MDAQKYIAFDIFGNILFFADEYPKEENLSFYVLKASPLAYKYISDHNLSNIADTDALSTVSDGVLVLNDEAGIDDYKSMVLHRVQAASPIMDSLLDKFGRDAMVIHESFSSIKGDNSFENAELEADAFVLCWMAECNPVWEIKEFTPDAATLVNMSKIDIDEDINIPAMYLRAKNRYLYGNINEILVFHAQDATMALINHRIGNFNLFYCGPLIQKSSNNALVDKDFEDALIFIKKFLAIKQCEKSPIEVIDNEEKKLKAKGIKRKSGIYRKQISLSKRYKAIKRERHEAMDKDGKVLTTINVSGYVRNQPYGEGNSLRKKIWIDGFTRGQWVRSGVTYVTIKE